jgi:hypothetical protein
MSAYNQLEESLIDAPNLENNRVGSIGASVENDTFALSPRKIHAVLHGEYFRKYNHQSTIADIPFYRFAVEYDSVTDLVTEGAMSFLAFHNSFNCARRSNHRAAISLSGL